MNGEGKDFGLLQRATYNSRFMMACACTVPTQKERLVNFDAHKTECERNGRVCAHAQIEGKHKFSNQIIENGLSSTRRWHDPHLANLAIKDWVPSATAQQQHTLLVMSRGQCTHAIGVQKWRYSLRVYTFVRSH